ncbi:transmembrane protease serine 5 isoform X2 [Trachemys scripta elegans]|uniref:transmembrane protease serine 5 isoform X2 n=1 Tax=Trachemys scripta elegans TaxID=31138 RepID=UPI0015573BF2|nr:transmembrane protease serine 5 isoform X2 [Trachemys scripta elegans]
MGGPGAAPVREQPLAPWSSDGELAACSPPSAAVMNLGSVPQFPIDLHSPQDAGQSQRAKTTEPRGEVGRTQTSAGNDSSNTSLENLCPIKRCLLLLGAIGLLAGAAIGMWLLVKFLTAPLSDQDPSPLQDVESIPICTDAREDEPVITTAPRRGGRQAWLAPGMSRAVESLPGDSDL